MRRIHLGHHFYGAGNLGDDFMLAGFLGALRELAPGVRCTGSVPFPAEPLRQRFPEVDWLPYEEAARNRAVAECDVWVGLGGSPFQAAQSRWFVDHLNAEAARCARAGKPRFFLGVGVQEEAELHDPEVRALVEGAAGIWTRDTASAERLSTLNGRVRAAADLAHVLFAAEPPPAARVGRVTLVANFDHREWPGQKDCLAAIAGLPAREQVWLAQESRDLPGAERALHRSLPEAERARWRLTVPDVPGAPLGQVMSGWPSGEWLVTSRYHAAIAGAWAGSRVVVVGTNEKLRGVAAALGTPLIAPEADVDAVGRALAAAVPCPAPRGLTGRAWEACREFLRSAVAPGG
jgi:polysaccharide pyruvyl transferase WcaK-like protein